MLDYYNMTEVFYEATDDDIKYKQLQLYSKGSQRDVYVPIIGTPDTESKNTKYFVKEKQQEDGTWKMVEKTKPIGGKKRKSMRSKRLKRFKRRTYKNK